MGKCMYHDSTVKITLARSTCFQPLSCLAFNIATDNSCETCPGSLIYSLAISFPMLIPGPFLLAVAIYKISNTENVVDDVDSVYGDLTFLSSY